MNDQDRNEWLENLERRLVNLEERHAQWERELKELKTRVTELIIDYDTRK